LNDKNDPVRWLKDLIDDYEKSEITLANIISEVPVVGGWLHNALPQFQTFTHQQCLLILGFCPQYGEIIAEGGIANTALTTTTCFSDVFASSIARIFGNVICLCARKDCRKVKGLGRGELP
jgi:hypothetical protein